MKRKHHELWDRYYKNRTHANRNRIVVQYMRFARKIANNALVNASLFGLGRDDIISFAMLGLMDAVERYDINAGASFVTYAHRRIKGHIIDEIRKLSWIPRIEMKDPKHEMHTFGDTVFDGKEWDEIIPLKNCLHQRHEFVERESWDRLVKPLRSIEKLIMEMYYIDGMTLLEIGLSVGKSDSRVCQIHARALTYLAETLNGKPERPTTETQRTQSRKEKRND